MRLRVGAKGLIARGDGKVLIVREAGDTYAEGTEEGKWDVVGGRIEDGEKLVDGLLREIKEESGLDVSDGLVIGATETFPIIKNEQHHIIRVYYACTTNQSEVILSQDHDKYEWIDPQKYADFNIMKDLHKVFANYLKLV